jgi:hypothetical protein
MLNKLKKKQPHISLPMPVKPASCDEVGILTEAGEGEAVNVLEGSSKSRRKGKGRKRSFVPKEGGSTHAGRLRAQASLPRHVMKIISKYCSDIFMITQIPRNFL